MPTRNSQEPGRLPVSERVLEVGARLGSGPSELLVDAAFKKELEEQAGLFEAMGLVDLAHTLMMTEAGIIPSEAGRELLAALWKLHERPADFALDPAKGDLYTNREAWLVTQTGASAWLGAGRARREATTTALLITLREGLLGLTEALTRTGRTIIARAGEFRTVLMPDYTYLQSAQPTTFGHYLLGFVFPMLRDLDRTRDLYGRVNRSPAGCGSTNGSRLPQDRERLRALLGFDGLVTHARDAMWQADLPIEAAAVLTAALINLDRLAEDLQIFSTEEFDLVELDDSHARASKIMPQKKNPFALTHVRGMANTMIGTLAASAAAGRTPSGQPDNRLPLYGTIPRAIGDTRDAVELMGEVVSLLEFNVERGYERLTHGFALATDLAEVLVLESALDFRQAHRLVSHLVRTHLVEGDLNRLTPDELASAAAEVLGRRIDLPEPALRNALDPEVAVLARTMQGGAAPEAVEVMIAECGQALAEADDWMRTCRRRLRMAEDSLLRITRDYCRRSEDS
jgi:argininosuccinate lyase